MIHSSRSAAQFAAPRSRQRRRAIAVSTAIALGASALAVAPLAQAASPVTSASWLNSYFNNVAVGDAGTNYADFDNLGSYLVRSDSAGVGIQPNTEQSLSQDPTLKYSISGGVAGQPDNVAMSSVSTTLNTHLSLGSGATTAATKVSFVGAATNGSKSVQATFHFADASTQSVNVQFSDWCDSDPQGTNTLVARWTQRWYGGSPQTLGCGLWASETYTLAPTTPGSTLESIEFGSAPNFHLFAIANNATVNTAAISIVGNPAPSISSSSTYSPGATVSIAQVPTWSTSAGAITTDAVKYVWQLDGQTVPLSNGSQYTLQPADAGKQLTVSITGSKAGYIPGSVTSNPMTINKGVFAATTAPTLSSATARAGDTLTTTAGEYSITDTAQSVQWLSDGVAISGANAPSYTIPAAQVGKALSARVTATKVGYEDVVTVLGPTSAVAKGQFTTTISAAIGGNYAVGQSLNVSSGTYSSTGVTETYRWTADGSDLSGATAAALELTPALLGKTIGVKVTAAKPGYEDLSYAVAGPTVADGTLAIVTAPAVSGLPVVGRSLTAAPGTYNPVAEAVSYEWSANNVAISGATGATFVPTTGLVGKQLTLKVTVKAIGYTDLVSVVPVGVVSKETLTVTKDATLTGTVAVGAPVKVTAGTYSAPGVSISYQWLANGVAIAKATGTSYTPSARDKNKGLSVRITATKLGYTSVVTTTSQLTVKIGTIKVIKKPAVTKKTPQVAKKLKVSKGSYKTAGVKVTYQWYRASKKIAKATKANYKVTIADRGKKLRVKVTVKKSGYKTVTIQTKSTKKVR